MSMKCFLAVEEPLNKTAYKYKDILPTMQRGDMWCDGGIAFREELKARLSPKATFPTPRRL